jgi:hypothetical protein
MLDEEIELISEDLNGSTHNFFLDRAKKSGLISKQSAHKATGETR